MNIQDVWNATGLARNTVGNLYKDTVKRIDYKTIEKLCELFHRTVGELLVYEVDVIRREEFDKNVNRIC